MQEWYYILGMIVYGIFILQFLLSFLGIGDYDLDVDFDGNIDFDVSTVISFKGLIHFLMGFSSWLMLVGDVSPINIFLAVFTGILFVVILYFVYRLCMKLNYEPEDPKGKALIGISVIVCIKGDNYVICRTPGGIEYKCKCDRDLNISDVVTIKDYKNGIYYVS